MPASQRTGESMRRSGSVQGAGSSPRWGCGPHHPLGPPLHARTTASARAGNSFYATCGPAPVSRSSGPTQVMKGRIVSLCPLLCETTLLDHNHMPEAVVVRISIDHPAASPETLVALGGPRTLRAALQGAPETSPRLGLQLDCRGCFHRCLLCLGRARLQGLIL